MASSNNTTNNEFNDPYAIYDIYIPVAVRFWWYLILDILSILCALFVLYQLLFDRALRQALNNHIIIVLLFIGLIYESTTVPFMLNYYRFRNTWVLTANFSRFWTLVDYTSYGIELMGFAWATIERHILIFHQPWVATKKKRFFIHYLPIMVIIIYCFTYYFVVIFFPSCQNSYYMQPLNGVPLACSSFDPVLGKYDTICHHIIPTCIIAIFSIGLLIRVLWQKSRMNRSIQWRQQRKMTIQLLSISILYLLFNLPRTIVQAFVISGSTSDLVIKTFTHLTFFAVQLIFYFPFVCCGLIPDVGKRLTKIFFCYTRRQVVHPSIMATETKRTNRAP